MFSYQEKEKRRRKNVQVGAYVMSVSFFFSRIYCLLNFSMFSL
jgi:hypothetical protein